MVFRSYIYQRIVAGMYKANTASAAVSKKSGMVLCKDGTTSSGVEFQEYEIKN